MQEKLMRRTAVFTAVFAVAAMALMFYYSSVKVIVIAEEYTDAQNQAAAQLHTEHTGGRPFPLQEQSGSEYLNLSLPDEVTPDHIYIDNHYMEHIVEIGIKGVTSEYYEKEVPSGQCDKIAEAVSETEDDTLRICFTLTDTYEVDYVYETGKLSLRFVPPDELYDRIVILDSGEQSRDGIVSEITSMVKEKLEAEGIKVYDVGSTAAYGEKEKQAVISGLQGDMYLALEIGNVEDKEQSGMEAFYNHEFFIPFVGNVTLADAVLREAALQTSGSANGLFPYEDGDTVLAENTIPSARLRLGYRKNREDMERLRSEEGRTQLAEGISAGIMKCYGLWEQYGEEQ